ncbi:hypothetical protein K443DRAFT_682659 [Laccaria amethystina LaAM-08-1]|uniref:Uncharacterized protein n=1 Tax=Laccaria amethystina LaAM-08-1 TaxID=1095629 RepID=A0A0C9XID1_9AGAR|nr:hypothetical protein K443DRAFT_682659 [Laccaria amethystina LaAM-08-1]
MMGQKSEASNLETESSWNFLAGNVGAPKFSAVLQPPHGISIKCSRWPTISQVGPSVKPIPNLRTSMSIKPLYYSKLTELSHILQLTLSWIHTGLEESYTARAPPSHALLATKR